MYVCRELDVKVMKKDIEWAIRTTLVVKNKESIPFAVDMILQIIDKRYKKN